LKEKEKEEKQQKGLFFYTKQKIFLRQFFFMDNKEINDLDNDKEKKKRERES